LPIELPLSPSLAKRGDLKIDSFKKRGGFGNNPFKSILPFCKGELEGLVER